MVRKSGASGLPKPASGKRSGSAANKGGRNGPIQVTSYQLDACELIGNRINKKLREHLDCIRQFAVYREVSL